MHQKPSSEILSAKLSDISYDVLREEQDRILDNDKKFEELEWDIIDTFIDDYTPEDISDKKRLAIQAEMQALELESTTSRQLIEEMKEAGAVALKDSGVVLYERAFAEARAAGVHVNVEQPEAITQLIKVHRSPLKH